MAERAEVPFAADVHQRPDADLQASVGGSVLGYWRFGGSVGYRSPPWFVHVYSQAQERAQRIYHLNLQNTNGPDAPRQFDIMNWASGGVLGARLLPSLSLSVSTSYLWYSSAIGADEILPQDPGILNPATSTQYVSVGGHLYVDRRDVWDERHFGNRFIPSSDNLTDRPLNPESGSLVSLSVMRFQEVTSVDANFHAFWAAKQIANFTRSDIQTIVETGDYSHPETVDFLTRVLVERRDMIARAYLRHGGGLGRFGVEKRTLTFENFLAHPAFEREVYASAEVTWHRFDNHKGLRTGTLDSTRTTTGRVPIPKTPAPYLVAVIRRPGVSPGTTEVFLRRASGGREIVGIRRTAEGLPESPPQWTIIPQELRAAPNSASAHAR